MNRSKDLDTVAPDDLSIVSESQPESSPSPQPIPTPVPNSVNPNDDLWEKWSNVLGHTKTPFSSFLVHPKVFTFEEKDPNEDILLVLRPHWFTNVHWIIITLVMIFVPSLLTFVPLLGGFPLRFQFAAIVFWYLVTFMFAFEKFLSWYFDVFIITTHRVVDIDFYNLLDKKFYEADLEMIQDVTSRISGLSQTIFNYGNVLIQTAAEVNELEFEKIPNPEKVIKLLQELRENLEHHHN